MIEIRNFINRLSKFQKITCVILMFVFILFSILSVIIPTFANPNDNISINGQLWNEFIEDIDIDTIYLGSNVDVNIESLEAEEIYYFISSESLTLLELEAKTWLEYNEPLEITEEGSYIIYAKFIDNGVTSYINTDLLILNYYNINIDNNSWIALRSDLDYLYINEEKNINVEVIDDLPGIKSIKYYVSNELLNHEDLDSLSSSWNVYTNPILINEVGTYIIYAQVIDNNDKITYINSDYIIFDGYVEDFTIGRNSTSYINEEPYISSKSTITLNFNYFNASSEELINHTHNLMSSLVIPLGTKITLLDHITEKVYEYKIDESDYNYVNGCGEEDCIYPLTLFKEVGKDNDSFYSEITYFENGITEENFTVIFDLSNTNITINYNDVSLYMELHNANETVRPTLNNTVESFNIYYNVAANLHLSTDYSGGAIDFNSDSTTNINITTGLSYKYINELKVIDTTYENKKIGLSVKLIDSEGNIIEKEFLKSILFKVGDTIYHPEDDNTIRIDLNSGIEDINKTLKIITFSNNGILEEGTYYFKISNYVSYDGYYYDELGSTELSIPVNVSDNIINIPYSFGVIMNDINRIIDKKEETANISFNILQNGELENPNIKISLYKKDQITAYDQNYTVVDLAAYVSDALSVYENNVYFVSTNPVQYIAPEYLYNNFELNLITNNFENTGYKFVFELYDGIKKIGTIEKHFIVRGEQHE